MVEAVEGKRDELLVVRKLPAGEKENDDDAARPPISAASACLLAVDFADGLLPLPFTVLSLDDNVVGMDDELVVVLAALLLLLLLGATDSFPPLNDVIDLLPSCEKKKKKVEENRCYPRYSHDKLASHVSANKTTTNVMWL